MSKLRQTAAGGGKLLSLIALAIILLGFAAPAHAADDNAISLTMRDYHVFLSGGWHGSSRRQGVYTGTTSVEVGAKKSRGFNLAIKSNTGPDLINARDRHSRIPLRYSVGNGWLSLPFGNKAPATIVDTSSEYNNANCKGKDHCEVKIDFVAPVDLYKTVQGTYFNAITYIATVNPAPKPVDWTNRTAKANPSETCEAGNANSSCLVTLDKNMIPVKYTGSTTNAQWTSVADPEAANSGWYDYANKQWANAVTVKKEALSKYRGFSKVVDQSDILGFWVYIPRYRYKVLRYSGSDPAVPAQNFTIEFENKQSTKATPTANGTWATHPAFTFGIKELNGIWFAKFETTGTTSQPTVLPNEAHISGYYNGMDYKVGNFYSLSKTLGVNDPNNVGGGDFTTTQNNHHLARLNSHMVNNNDWGAATYLSASKYGAGYNKVQINANGASRNIYGSTYGTTGCGPQANGNTSSYSDSGTLGTPQACGNADRAYNGTLGQLASTTNNPTGIYDMSGGGWEYTASSYTSDLNNSSTNYFSQSAHPPYVNNYNFTETNNCTFATCGGQALYETNNGSGNGSNQWNGNYMYFVTSSNPWFVRGGFYYNGSSAGLFYANGDNGYAYYNVAFRVALAPLQD